MFAALKAEFRKLLTVRTTYAISGICLAIVAFYAFYIEGIHGSGRSPQDAMKLASEVPGAIQAVATLGTMIAVLLMTHEYRYNTIMYTLTSARRRMAVLTAKVLAVSVFALLFAVAVGALAPVSAYLGMQVHGADIAVQSFPWWDLIWQNGFYMWAYMMFGLSFAVLFRSQVASIIILFFVPSTIEVLASLLLKHNAIYLPFSALGRVLQTGMHVDPNGLSAGHAALVAGGYLVVIWTVAAVLFMRRDAN
jgi:ABC-2 type transport system permease protein